MSVAIIAQSPEAVTLQLTVDLSGAFLVAEERLQSVNNQAESLTVEGVHASTAWFSVVEAAKVNGLELYQYLKYLFTELPCYQQQALVLE